MDRRRPYRNTARRSSGSTRYHQRMSVGPRIRRSAGRRAGDSRDSSGSHRRQRRARPAARIGRGFNLAHALQIMRPELADKPQPRVPELPLWTAAAEAEQDEAYHHHHAPGRGRKEDS